MVLTPHLQEQIRTMRTAGVTYSKISEFLDLNVNSVKSWCRRNNFEQIPQDDAAEIRPGARGAVRQGSAAISGRPPPPRFRR